MMACALPLRKRSWQTMTGAARVLLVVNVPAATQGTFDAKIARSVIEPSDLMPLAITPARKPCGAVTQLSTSRNISDNEHSSYHEKLPVRYVTKTGNQKPIDCSIVQCWKIDAQPAHSHTDS